MIAGTTSGLERPGPDSAHPTPHRPPIAWVPLALAILMEAAWISVIAGLVQEFALREPVLGIPWMAAFVALGVGAARFAEARHPNRWPLAGTLLVFIAAIAGVALAPDARASLGAGGIAGALARNPGGMLAGVAVLRGYAHAGDRVAVDTAARALFIGIPLVAIAAAIGGMVAEPWRSGFLRDAAFAAGCFTVAGLLTLAVAALDDVRPAGAAAWRANPVWAALVVVAIAGLLAVAVPIGFGGGPSIAITLEVLVAGSIFPLAVAGMILGGRAGLRRLLMLVGGTAFVVLILSFARSAGTPDARTGSGSAAGSSVNPALDPVGVASISGIATLVIAVVVFLLIRAWMRRQEPLPDDLLDERSADLPRDGTAEASLHRHRRRPWTRDPRTAPEAYLALVEDLHDVPDVRRKPAETPAEHARRLRVDQITSPAGIGLELLAADFGLVAFGDRTLTGAENRRAIGRWRRLRRELRVRPADAPARRSVTDDDAPPNPMKPNRPY